MAAIARRAFAAVILKGAPGELARCETRPMIRSHTLSPSWATAAEETPNSSDGVVAYWSSHLDGAQSERIVPSADPAHQNKQGMEEVHRILIMNIRS